MPRCHICPATPPSELVEVPGFDLFRTVTSDSRPWKSGKTLGVCSGCGTLQTALSSDWRRDIERIYASYQLYEVSGGEEQRKYRSSDGSSLPRSEWLLQILDNEAPVRRSGKLLDIGYGNGATLRAFRSKFPNWELTGFEPTGKSEKEIRALLGDIELHHGELESVPGRFDLITLIHVLEHVEKPIALLKQALVKLTDRIVIQVPDFTKNPFDLLVADHATHFSAGSLASAAARAGVEATTCQSIDSLREIVLVGNAGNASPPPQILPEETLDEASRAVSWLATVRDLSMSDATGVFGTAIAATWLAAECAERVRFFVDEDPKRIGRTHLGRPVISPEDIAAGERVILPFREQTARSIAERLSNSRAVFLVPK